MNHQGDKQSPARPTSAAKVAEDRANPAIFLGTMNVLTWERSNKNYPTNLHSM